MAGPLKFEIEIVDRQPANRAANTPTPQQPVPTPTSDPTPQQQAADQPVRLEPDGEADADLAERVRRRAEELAGLRADVAQVERDGADEGAGEDDRRAANDLLGELLARILRLQDEHRADADELGLRAAQLTDPAPAETPALKERPDDGPDRAEAAGDGPDLAAEAERVRRQVEDVAARLQKSLESLIQPTDEVRDLFDRLAAEELPVPAGLAEPTEPPIQPTDEVKELFDRLAGEELPEPPPAPADADLTLPPDEPGVKPPAERGGGFGGPREATRWGEDVRRRVGEVELDFPGGGKKDRKPEWWPEDLPHPSDGQGKKEDNPFDNSKGGMNGLDRLLYQTGFGKLGNFFAMFDKMQESGRKGDTGIAGMLPVLGVAQAAGSVVAGGADAANAGIRGAGTVGAGIARNDIRAVEQAVDAVTAAARKIPVVGEAFGATVDLMIAPAKALRDVFESLAARGKELAGYSGAISEAQAMAEVSTILADIKEANAMGGEYASLIRLENEFQMAWREAILPIKKMLAQFLSDEAGQMKELIAKIGEGMATLLKYLLPVIEIAMKAAAKVPEYAGGVLAGILGTRLAAEATAENTRKPEPDPRDLMDSLYRVLGSASTIDGLAPADLAGVAGVTPLEVPLLRR